MSGYAVSAPRGAGRRLLAEVRHFGLLATVAKIVRFAAFTFHRLGGADAVVRRVHGLPMYLATADPGLSRELFVRREREAQLRLVLDEFTRPGHRVLDLGANLGYYTLFFLERVGPTGHVHAIEPSPRNYDLLQRTLRLNCSLASNVSTEQVAAGSSSGDAVLQLTRAYNLNSIVAAGSGASASSSPRATTSVGVVSTTDLIDRSGPVDLIRMDVEGYETEVLAGLRAAIVAGAFSGAICFEVHTERYNDAPYRMHAELEFLALNGYRATVVTSAREEDGVFARLGLRPERVVRTHALTTRGIYRDVPWDVVVTLVADSGGVRDILLTRS